jgi:hypothetical protein
MGTSSDGVIGRLTAEQALRIVQQLSRRGGEIGDAVRAQAMDVLTGVDWDETAEELFCALDARDARLHTRALPGMGQMLREEIVLPNASQPECPLKSSL